MKPVVSLAHGSVFVKGMENPVVALYVGFPGVVKSPRLKMLGASTVGDMTRLNFDASWPCCMNVLRNMFWPLTGRESPSAFVSGTFSAYRSQPFRCVCVSCSVQVLTPAVNAAFTLV